MTDTLDEEKLATYLELHIAGFKGQLTATKFEGGQSNPTYKINAESGQYVLRSQPLGKLLKSAHAVDREFKVYEALAGTNVPVPKVYHLCEDRDVIGSMFYVMDLCEGRIFWDAALPQLGSNDERAQAYEHMNSVLAAIHSVDIEKVGLSDDFIKRMLEIIHQESIRVQTKVMNK